MNKTFKIIIQFKKKDQTGLLLFQNTSTTNFQKTSLTWETDYYSYKKISDKNTDFKVREKSGRAATLNNALMPGNEIWLSTYVLKGKLE